MKTKDFIECSLWALLLILVVIVTGCAPGEDTTVNNNDCVIYAKSKRKCKHGHCTPLPTATPGPLPTSAPEASGSDTETETGTDRPLQEDLSGCTVVEGAELE